MNAHLPPFATKQLRTSLTRLIEIALRSQFHTGATLHVVTGSNERTGKRMGVGRGRGPRAVPATTRGLVRFGRVPLYTASERFAVQLCR